MNPKLVLFTYASCTSVIFVNFYVCGGGCFPSPLQRSGYITLTFLADGKLHQLGEGLRKMSHSHRLADLVSGGSGGSIKRINSGGNVEVPPKIHSGPELGLEVTQPLFTEDRTLSAPQMTADQVAISLSLSLSLSLLCVPYVLIRVCV